MHCSHDSCSFCFCIRFRVLAIFAIKAFSGCHYIRNLSACIHTVWRVRRSSVSAACTDNHMVCFYRSLIGSGVNSLLCKNVENLDDNVLGPLDICLGFLEVSSEFAFSPIMIQLIQ